MFFTSIIDCYYFCTVDAQASCVINPNITTLTLRDGLVRNVEFHCQCRDGNGMITTGTSWFHNGASTTITLDDPNLPTNTHNILFIAAPFDSSDSGTYTCSPITTFPTTPPGDVITLNAGSECITIIIVPFV